MSDTIDLEQLRDRQDSIEETIRRQNERINTDMVELRQALNVQYPHHGEDEDNMDILVSGHLRDVSREPRPQMSGAGLASSNKHFRDLTNHELHKIKKIHEADHKQKPRTVLAACADPFGISISILYGKLLVIELPTTASPTLIASA